MFDKKDFLKQIDEFVFYQDDINGAKLYRELSNEDKQIISGDEELLGAFWVLLFIIIPFLSTKEIVDLFTEHLTVGLMVNDFDLKEKITKKLISLDLSDRDNCKDALKSALLANKETITEEVNANGNKIKTISDWLRDYLSQVGLKATKSLEHAKYFSEKSYVVNLDDDDKKLLKKIIELYKFLNTSSLTPEGFEDDLLLKDKDGRIITTNKGKIVILYDPKKETKKSEVKTPAVEPVAAIISEQENNINQLNNLAAQYPAGSFERKAIEEEIKKLNQK